MLCPKCSTVNSENEKYCKNCGFQLNATRICPDCGSVNEHNAKFCDKCGASLSPVNTFKKDMIGESKGYSFLNKYKTLLIAALILVLACGAVAGIAIYNGNQSGGGDDSLDTIVPIFNDSSNPATEVNNSTSNDSDTNKTVNSTLVNTSDMNKTINSTLNSSNSSLLSKLLNANDNKSNTTAKANNKTMNNSNNKINSTVNKTVKSNKTNDKKVKTNKSIDKTTKVNNSNTNLTNVDKNTKTNKSSNDTTFNTDFNTSNNSNYELILTDVPNLAKEVADNDYEFTSLDYKGHNYTKVQCIDIFANYLLKIDNGDDSPIEVKDVKEASNPSGEDLNNTIVKDDYLSIAQRLSDFVDKNGRVPNYIGISAPGQADLSPDKMLYLFTQTVLNYAVTDDLPDSVEI